MREDLRTVSVFELSDLDLGAPANDFEALAQKTRLLIPALSAFNVSMNRYDAIQAIKEAEHPASATLEELDHYQTAHAKAAEHNAAICAQFIRDLIALRPRVNLAWQQVRAQLLSQGFDPASVTPDEMGKKFSELWQTTQSYQEKFKLSDPEMTQLGQWADQQAQRMRGLSGPPALPDMLLDDKWDEMFQAKLRQLQNPFKFAGGFCIECGAQIKLGKHFCTKCGAPVTPTTQTNSQPTEPTCSNCGRRVPAGKKFCTSCGTRLVAN